jgi:type I restriction enzyme S subunit
MRNLRDVEVKIQDIEREMVAVFNAFGLDWVKGYLVKPREHDVEMQETKIGLIPKDWRLSPLIDICEKPQYGYTESATTKDTGVKFLRITDIQEGFVDWEKVPYCKITPKEFEKFKLNEGDILFARIGATTGKSYLVRENPSAVFASYLIRVRAKFALDPAFLFYFFNTDKYWMQINIKKHSNLKKGMSASVLSQLLVPLPTIEEQKQIARVFGLFQKRMSLLTIEKNRMHELFGILLQQLMTGTIRVNNIDFAAP